MKTSLTLLALAMASVSPSVLRAQSITFTVDLNTAGLSADSANAPFYLDFQLNYGNSALASNTATLSNFQLTGGSAIGSAVTSGSATGNITSTAALTASHALPLNELYQQFASTVTDIKFTATITEAGPDIGAPTEFTAAILDSSTGSPAQLFTTAADTASLVTLNLSSSNTLAAIGTYGATASADDHTPLSNITASVIPEPSTTAALIGAAAALFALGARRFRLFQIA